MSCINGAFADGELRFDCCKLARVLSLNIDQVSTGLLQNTSLRVGFAI